MRLEDKVAAHAESVNGFNGYTVLSVTDALPGGGHKVVVGRCASGEIVAHNVFTDNIASTAVMLYCPGGVERVDLLPDECPKAS